MSTLELALEELTTTYKDLDLIARSLVVDPAEIAQAILTTEEDSAEGVALRMLAKYNPFVPPAKIKSLK